MLGLKHTAVMSKLLHLCIEGFLRHVFGWNRFKQRDVAAKFSGCAEKM